MSLYDSLLVLAAETMESEHNQVNSGSMQKRHNPTVAAICRPAHDIVHTCSLCWEAVSEGPIYNCQGASHLMFGLEQYFIMY